MTLLAGLVIISATLAAIVRKIDVRLALLSGALALGVSAGQPMVIVRTFVSTFSSEQFFVPIGGAVGFAYVLRHTGCEQHLVQLLVAPLRWTRFLLVPGVVLVGFAVNCPVVSQVGTAVSIGAVLVPLLRASRIRDEVSGAALLLGCSLGGDLLNPGAPEWQTVAQSLNVDPQRCVQAVGPLLLGQLLIATLVFWWINRDSDNESIPPPQLSSTEAPFRVNPIKAVVPLVPVVLLFLAGPPFQLFEIPKDWLTDTAILGDARFFRSRQIGAAMLVGVLLASATAPRAALQSARVFFEGAGYAMTHIISLIVAATCFGKGIESIGVKDVLGRLIGDEAALLLPIAGVLPLGFGMLCGSGMATTQAVFGFFVDPAASAGVDPFLIGAVVAIAASAGRTMSPVAAIVLMSGRLTETDPLRLIRRVFVPLLVATSLTVAFAWVIAVWR